MGAYRYRMEMGRRMIESDLPDEFVGYDQRPCPSCGHVDGHYPMAYTEAMVVLCSECQYEFVKRPAHLETLEMDATSNDKLRELIEQWRSDGNDLIEKTERESLRSNGRARLGCADQVEELIECK